MSTRQNTRSTTAEDAQLIAATLAGNPAAFGELVRKYQNRLFNMLFCLLRDRHEAEDLAQEAFVQAFLKLRGFRQSSQFYTWLYRIAYNLAASRRQSARQVASLEQSRAAGGLDPIESGPLPHEKMLTDERRELVWQAIYSLPEDQRMILILREIDGCCYETIAEILGIPVGTVKSRLFRARLHLRQKLLGLLDTDEQHDRDQPR